MSGTVKKYIHKENYTKEGISGEASKKPQDGQVIYRMV